MKSLKCTTVSFFLMIVSSVAVYAQTYQPIAVTGFNHDVVANGSGTPFASTTQAVDGNINNIHGGDNVLYVKGYQCFPEYNLGLPVNGSFTSGGNSFINYQFASYDASNALFIPTLNSNGILSLAQPQKFTDLSFLAFSTEGSSSMSVVLNFTDGSSTSPFSFDVIDWFNGPSPAITSIGRINGGVNCLTDVFGGGNPNMYDHLIHLTAGDQQKFVQSITVTNTGAVNNSGRVLVMAVSGAAGVNAPPLTFNSISATPETCPNVNNGTITVNYSGGSLPYTLIFTGTNQTYTFNGIVATSYTLSNLAPAVYNVKVRDANNNEVTNTVTVNAAAATPPPVIVTSTGNNSICPGSNLTLSAPASGKSLHFTNGSYIEAPSTPAISLTNALSIEAWVKTDNPGLTQYIVTKSNNDQENGQYGLLIVNGKFQFHMWQGTHQGTTAISPVIAGTWYHVVGTWDGTTTKIYVNGVLENQASFAGPMTANNSPLRIGILGVSCCPYPFYGEIDEVRIWNRAISQAEAAIQTGVAIDPSLMAYYKLDEGSGITTADKAKGNTAGLVNAPVWLASTAPIYFSGYNWSPSGSTNPTLTVNAAGSYGLTVRDANGCYSTSSPVNVSVAAPATISASGPTSFCAGGSVVLTANAGTAYSWSNGATSQSILVSTSGNYSVTVTDANGCSATSVAIPVVVNALPAPVISGPSGVCLGSSIALTGSPAGGTWSITSSGTLGVDQSNGPSGHQSGSTFQWQSFTAGVTGALTSIDISHGNPQGTNSASTITVRVYSGVGVGGTLLGSQSYNYPAQWGSGFINYAFTGINLVQGQQYTFSVTTPTVTYSWLNVNINGGYAGGNFGPSIPQWDMVFKTYMNPVIASIDANGILKGLLPGTATVKYFVTDNNGCSNTVSTAISVNTLPTATITAGGATTLCTGGSVNLTASTGTAYLWSTGATSQSINVTASGNYSVTVTNAQGCSATSAATTVTVNAIPVVSISGSNAICPGLSTTLTASGASTYVWSNNVSGNSLPLDNVANAYKLAVGLRKLRSAYAGNAIRLRRSTDNVEQNFGFVGTELDLASISTFLGAASGFITTLYDQSGTGNNLIQAATGQQPLFVASGLNSKPVIRVTAGTQQRLYNTTNFAAPFTAIYGSKQTGPTRGRMLTDVATNWLLGFWGGQKGQAYFNGWVSGGTNPSNSNPYVYTGTGTGSVSTLYENGTQLFSNGGGLTGPNGISMGAYGCCSTEWSDGDFTELFIFNTVLSTTDRQLVENSTGAYYGIFGNAGPTTASVTVNPVVTTGYTVTGTSATGCVATTSITVTVNALPTATTSKVDVVCIGSNTGSITVNGSGGTAPYQYSNDGGETYQPSNIFSGLSVGNYSIFIKDANSCPNAVGTVTIIQVDNIPPTISGPANITVYTGASSLIANYPLLTNLTDASGNFGAVALSGNSTAPASPTAGNPLCVNGIYFYNPGGQNVQTPPISTLNTSSFELAIDFRLSAFPTSTSGYPVIVGGSGWRWIGIDVSQSGKAGILWNNSNRTYSSTQLNLNQWYSAKLVYSNNTANLYIDGNLVHTVVTGALVTGNDLNFTTNDFASGRSLNGCIRNLQIFNNAVSCDVTVSFTAPVGTDNCSGSTTLLKAGLAPGSKFPVGVTTETYEVTDASGNKASYSFDVKVVDNQPPTITCPSNITGVTATSASGAVVNYTTPVGTDNCSGVITILQSGLASGSTFPIGTSTITYRATDAAGNHTDCSFTVTVSELAPSIVCPANISVSSAGGQCGANVNFAATETTGIPASTITYSLNPGSFFTVGTHTVTATAFNGVGTSSCTFSVTVVDKTPPIPTVAVLPTITGECSATVTAPTATDNCAGTLTATTSDPVNYNSQGTFTITWTYNDGNGNSTTQTQTVTVKDNTSPIPTVAVLPTITGECSATVTAPTATDNCAGTLTATTSDPVSYSSQGTFTITWTYNDGNGYSTTQTQNVIIKDNTAPVLNGTLPGNSNGQCLSSVPAAPGVASIAAQYSDNCSGVTAVLVNSTTTGNNANGWAVQYTYQITDANGNNTSAFVNYSGKDNTAPVTPVAVLPDITITTTGSVTVVPTASDNCAGNIIATTTDPLSYPKPGNYTITWRYNDGNGNITLQTQTVTVIDVTPPTIACIPSIIQKNDPGQPGAVVNYLLPGVTDNISSVSITVSEGYGDGTISFNTPVSNNVSSLNFISSGDYQDIAHGHGVSINVTVDLYNPSTNQWIQVKSIETGTGDYHFGGTTINFPVISQVSKIRFTTSQPIGAALHFYELQVNLHSIGLVQTAGMPSGSFFPLGTTKNTFKATDQSGNIDSCSFTITVTDEEKPKIINYAGSTRVTTTNCNWGGNGGTFTLADNAPGSLLLTEHYYSANGTKFIPDLHFTLAKGPYLLGSRTFPVGVNRVLLSAKDAAGNLSDTISFTVTVIDSVKPTLVTSGNITQSTDPGVCGAYVNVVSPVAQDNCAVQFVINDFTKTSNATASYPVGFTVVTWTATDIHGNKTTATQTITVTDDESPMIIDVPVNIVQTNDVGTCGATITWPAVRATDNCRIVSFISNHVSGEVFPLGETTVIFTATDNHNNISTASFTISITDNEAPSVITKPVTVTLVNGRASIAASDINNGSFDNCGTITLSASKTQFTCADAGINTVNLTVTDSHGNTSVATALVTVAGGAPSVNIVAVPSNNINTGGISTDIYLGYGPQSVTLNASITGLSPVTYSWSRNATLSCYDCMSPVFTPTAPGLYSFTVTVTNLNGCSTTSTITVCVRDIKVPSTTDKVYVCHTDLLTGAMQTLILSVNSVANQLLLNPQDKLGSCSMAPCGVSPVSTTQAVITEPVVPEKGTLIQQPTKESKVLTGEMRLTVNASPNPSNGAFRFVVTTNRKQPVQVRIMDAAGRLVEGLNHAPIGTPFRMGAQLISGIYYAEVIQGKERVVLKLIKQNW